MRVRILGFFMVGLLAGCSADWQPQGGASAMSADPMRMSPLAGLPSRERASFGTLADRGDLLAYDRSRQVRRGGAYTWHPIELSEAHAMRAVASGELTVTAPNGQPIRLRYDRHVEHDNGNWTWIGRVPGGQPGTEAIITFGEKAAFGSIPYGDEEPLRLTIAGGRAWLVETDRKRLALMDNTGTRPRKPDYLAPPRTSQQLKPASELFSAEQVFEAASVSGAAATATTTTVDVLLGYTNGFATRLGGQSQANTRLTFLVDVANQAYVNSQIPARLRLVRTRQVTYADATKNETALYELTGVECTETPDGLDCDYVGTPTSLQPLLQEREQYGADLVSLVRNFNDPENDGCGLAWLNGAGQTAIQPGHADYGISVVSDSSGNLYPDNGFICSNETLVHELGHNMGSNHDRETSEGDDGVLDPEDYGRYPYSFGHKTAAGQGNFYTVMAYGDSGQTKYRVFSNPNITYCGGRACGVANTVDNARSLRQTIPVIATFRNTVVPEPTTTDKAPSHFDGDFNGDGKSDILWRNMSTGANAIWRSANKATPQAIASVTNLQWQIVGVGDFNGDGKSDILWRNTTTGANTIWKSANSATLQSVASVTNLQWQIIGVGDFNGDNKSDILWRNTATGANTIWKSANSATLQSVASVTNLQWQIAGVGDFNGDGKSDVLWRNTTTGANTIWKSANSTTLQYTASVTNLQWQAVGMGDFNGDGKSDILWRNTTTGANTIWKSANSATLQSVSSVTNLQWRVAGVSDFSGDGKSDILWRDFVTGGNSIWKSANSVTPQAVDSVTDLAWVAMP